MTRDQVTSVLLDGYSASSTWKHLAVGFSPGWREGSSRATCLLLTPIRNSGPVEEPYHVPWSHLPVSSRPLRLKPQLPENKQVSCISCISSEKQVSCFKIMS